MHTQSLKEEFLSQFSLYVVVFKPFPDVFPIDLNADVAIVTIKHLAELSLTLPSVSQKYQSQILI